MEDIRDIKGFVVVPHDGWWLWLVLVVVLIAALSFWFSKRKRLATSTGPVAPLSPYEIAMRALQQLRGQNPDVEEFYTHLSDIVRRYLEGQLGLRAPEQTTEEFLCEMSNDHALSAEHKELLGTFLEESDLVKFARFLPDDEDQQRAFAAAERFVQETQRNASSAIATK